MKKFILYLILSLFITQNVYADVKVIGRCVGYLAQKIATEGKTSITKGNLTFMQRNVNEFTLLNKMHQNISKKNCIVAGQPLEPCLAGYNSYEKELYINMNTGIIYYDRSRYNQAKRAIYEMACSDNY